MTTISKLLVACAAMTFAASQAGAGELLVTGPGGYRYRYGPPPAHGYGPWRYQRREWARPDLPPRYYAPQYHPDLGAAIAGALAGAALQLIPRATEALAARLPPPPAGPPPPPKCGSAGCAKCPAARGGRPATGRAAGRGGRATTGSPAAPGTCRPATHSTPFRTIRPTAIASREPRSRLRSPTGARATATRRCASSCRRNESRCFSAGSEISRARDNQRSVRPFRQSLRSWRSAAKKLRPP